MPNILGTVTKTPTEEVPIGVDLGDVLPAGESIDNTTTSVTIKDRNGTDQTGAMLKQKTTSGQQVIAVLKAGTDGMNYTVTFVTITISTTYRFESFVNLIVAA